MSTINFKPDFSLIYKEQKASITRLCYLYLKNEALAQDAAQETFIKAYRNLSDFRAESDINTWLTAIAVNTCKSLMRKKSYKSNVSLNEAICIEHQNKDVETILTVSEAVKSLPKDLRVVAILKYYRELKTKDIAKILKLPATTINYRLSKAKEILREKLKEDFYD